MSEETKPVVAPSAAEIARKEAQAKLDARILELKGYAGKYFKRKGDTGPQTFEVIAYAGIQTTAKGKAHLFQVEGRNPGTRWTPIASEFLNEYEEIPAPKPAVEQEVI